MIERRSNISTSEFFTEYYDKSQPVILEGLAEDWPARSLWSPEYFRERCGDFMIEVMADRNADPDFEINCNRHKTQVKFSDYVDHVVSASGNNQYIVANNRFMETDAGRLLRQDIHLDRRYLDPNRTGNAIFFWFGPAGTITPLHYDVVNIFLTQVYGRKRFTLIPKNETHLMYNHLGVFSEVDYENPDYAKYPLFAQTTRMEIDLHPGETIFLPMGWWHHVRSLDVSVSVSFTNFLPRVG